MAMLFAHHGMLEGLDVFRIHPMTAAEHAVAFALYALLILVVAFVARAALRWCRTALASRTRQAGGQAPEALVLAESRP